MQSRKKTYVTLDGNECVRKADLKQEILVDVDAEWKQYYAKIAERKRANKAAREAA
jgi:DNA-binding transcriptional regulator/RsmH inhibitor MraZ